MISHLNSQDTSAFDPQIQSKGHHRRKSRKAKETSFINGHTLIVPTIDLKYRLIVFNTELHYNMWESGALGMLADDRE